MDLERGCVLRRANVRSELALTLLRTATLLGAQARDELVL